MNKTLAHVGKAIYDVAIIGCQIQYNETNIMQEY